MHDRKRWTSLEGVTDERSETGSSGIDRFQGYSRYPRCAAEESANTAWQGRSLGG
jgi:hypothetical protein